MIPAIARDLDSLSVFRILSTDTNKFAILADPSGDATSFVSVIEIFDVGGKTPPNSHVAADEIFYVLYGEGVAYCGEERFAIKRGDTFLVRPGNEHIVENTGTTRLYCLTTMVPNEAFAELIRAGVPDQLDAEDLRVLKAA